MTPQPSSRARQATTFGQLRARSEDTSVTVIHIRGRSGEYKGAAYRVIGTAATLIRMGLARPAATQTGISPRALPRRDGRLCLDIFADIAMRRDTRFQKALDRVLYGMPCANFELPLRRTRRSK